MSDTVELRHPADDMPAMREVRLALDAIKNAPYVNEATRARIRFDRALYDAVVEVHSRIEDRDSYRLRALEERVDALSRRVYADEEHIRDGGRDVLEELREQRDIDEEDREETE